MQHAQKIDFHALIMQPIAFTSAKAVKPVSTKTVRDLVRSFHPASRIKETAKLVKQA